MLPVIKLVVSMVDSFSGPLDASGVIIAIHSDQALCQLPKQLDLVLVLMHFGVERLQ